VLPPLLYAQAWFTSWKDFRDNLRPISMLAVGLVLFTTTVVAFVAHALVPELPLAAVTTGTFSLAEAGGGFALVVAGGVAVGLAVGWVFAKLLCLVRDDLIDIVLSLVCPYAAYLGAERLHFSGVLATVTAGIWLGARSPELLSASARLTGEAFWNTLVFLLNGVVFMLIGLQLPEILKNLQAHSRGELLGIAAALALIVIVTRIVWVFPNAYLPRRLSPRLRARDPMPPWRNITVVALAWCGMRGVVSLAAALAIPRTLPNGQEFPERDLILFFTFSIILVTLVGQGLSLPWLIRRLRVTTGDDDAAGEREARRSAAQAALERIGTFASGNGLTGEAVRAVETLYQERLHHLSDELADVLGWSPARQRAVESRRLFREAVTAEREHLIALHRQHRLSKDLLHKLEHELDLEEARLG